MIRSVVISVIVFAIFAFVASGRSLSRREGAEGVVRTPLVSPGGSQIALLYTYAGNTEVVVIDLKTAEGINVSNTLGEERDMAWSPDGKRLLFSSERDGNLDICAYYQEKDDVECLTNTPEDDFFPVWRPDGKKIAFCSYRGGNRKVFTMEPDGKNQLEFLDSSCFPTWSPDGKKMALTYNGDIYVVDIKNNRRKNITKPLVDGAWVEDTLPIWSPVKDRIILLGQFEAHLSEIYAISSGGKKLARISDNVYEDFFPAWSPDGEWIVYTEYVQDRRNTTEIFLSREDSSEKRRLTDNWVFDIGPSFAPNGTNVVFIRREGLKDRLYIMGVEDKKAELLFRNGFKITRTLSAKNNNDRTSSSKGF